ncbi:hypothetical protein IE81DRAFT_332020 [Ceraceosorus guamensis]|uniref:Uncharacterized protein n=1 Tax=Ceraceosorus guamensis TaxID=1522189 RepID=A0A316VTU1_9BASI|nr:hypothetical protein IE81DRAFT_332020 [Ceraceosorus guamensis]PWN39863.1 hypothetical protein IE81DRAFT_332020 [Ceraceosorus guamensis]
MLPHWTRLFDPAPALAPAPAPATAATASSSLLYTLEQDHSLAVRITACHALGALLHASAKSGMLNAAQERRSQLRFIVPSHKLKLREAYRERWLRTRMRSSRWGGAGAGVAGASASLAPDEQDHSMPLLATLLNTIEADDCEDGIATQAWSTLAALIDRHPVEQ